MSHEPDQAIAIGCGVAGGIKERNRDVRDLLLSDICPFTLGIAVYDNITTLYVLPDLQPLRTGFKYGNITLHGES